MAQMASDRNLLLGIIALQMDFITREALIAGMNAWVLAKDKSLGLILVDQAALARDELALLDPLVRKHLEKHGGDPERSLSALSAIGWIKHDLQAVADSDVRVSVGHLGVSDVKTDSEATQSYAAGASSSVGGRFRILRPHARGGQGEVYVARDTELNREVALKQLQADHADHAESRSRLVMEAELTGGLEHPGVVPVYGLGQFDDGRPFYAMRLIKGDSLRVAIERFHSAEGAGRDPGERSLALRQLLGRFVDVCNALAYAHSRGVLHRDLKPGNIMLGSYGETMVVDWGLAKSVGRREPFRVGHESTLRPSSASETPPTVMGAAIGTAPYMSPEQAAGRLDELGPASDVYSLGATLYCLLTGRAPFTGTERAAILRKVQSGDFPPPRRVKPAVPRALEAICLKAMAQLDSDRYPSPRVLADDIEHWLADEPVSAWSEPLRARARRWMQRHRTLVATATVTVLVGLVALGIGYVRVSAVNRQLDDAHRTVSAANQRLLTTNEELKQANERVNRSKTESDRRLDQTLQAIEDYCTILTVVPDAVLAKDQKLRSIEDRYPSAQPEVLSNPKAFQALREKLLQKPRLFYEQLALELKSIPAPDERTRFLLAKVRSGLGSLARTLGQYDPAKQQIAMAIALYRELAQEKPSALQYRRALAVTYDALGWMLRETGNHRSAADTFRQAIEVESSLVSDPAHVPGDEFQLAKTYNNLAVVLENTGELKNAANYIEKCTDVFESLSAAQPKMVEYHRDLANSYSNLSLLLGDTSDLAGAIQFARKSIEIAAKLVTDHPEIDDLQVILLNGYGALGNALYTRGDPSGAADAHQKAIEVSTRLASNHSQVGDYQHRLAIGYNNLGQALIALRDLPGAASAFRKGIELRIKLTTDYPDVPDYWRGLANKSTNLANVLTEMGEVVGAEKSLDRGIRSWTKLALDHPDVPDYQVGLARCYRNLQFLRATSSDLPGALLAARRAVEITRRLVSLSPDVSGYQSELASSYHGLARMQQATRQGLAADESYRRAIAVFSKLAVADSSIATYQTNLATCYSDLGALQQAAGQFPSAVASARRAIEIRYRLLSARSDDPLRRCELILSYNNLASVLQSTHDLAASEASLDRAIQIGTQSIPVPMTLDLRNEIGRSRGMLAWLHHVQGKDALAERELRQTIEDQRPLCRQAPRITRYRQSLITHLGVLARVFLSMNRPDEAFPFIRERKTLAERDFGAIYDVACDLALCVPLIHDPARKRAVSAEAVETLKMAVAAGWHDAAHTSRDPDFASLRDRDDFCRLLDELWDRSFPADPFAL
jgi:eukaryotic-like serine/threonine-protein kinase